MNKRFSEIPVFRDGMAQPVFPFTDGKTEEAYDPQTSSIVRCCVYVETDYDMDGDGKRDRIKVFVQVPRSAAEGTYKAASIFEARPYSAGIQEDAYEHMKEVQDKKYPHFDMNRLSDSPAPSVPSSEISTLKASFQADPKDWYYEDKGSVSGVKYCFDNIDLYDYYLIRGFAVVQSAGLGTRGSEGLECVGTRFEKEAFKDVIEWLHGDRNAYISLNSDVAVLADWSSGKTAMTGRSYGGTMPFAVATTGVPGLETIVPVAGIADWYSQQNQQGAQRYWPKEVLNSFLSYYCSSMYSDPEKTEAEKEYAAAYQYQMGLDQIQHGFDYSEEFWGGGNYTTDADKIKCTALIIHCLNDENVSTKQFEMMFRSFRKAGENVKLVLHQGFHMTPTMALKGYGFRINGKAYDDLVNEWYSHYLYGVENHVEDCPEVLVQDNRNQEVWHTVKSWETGTALTLDCIQSGTAEIDTDWERAGVTSENYDERMSMRDSNMNRRLFTDPLKQDIVIQGTTEVRFSAALHSGDAEAYFHPENPNDADTLTMKTGTDCGHMDDVKMTVMLCDVADEDFCSIQTSDPERNEIPMSVISKGTLINGGDLENFDEIKFDTAKKKYKVISRSYIDLCNPDSGYDPRTAADSIELKPGEYHDYHIYLNAQRYTVTAGHHLVLVLTTEDPVECLIHKQYSISVKEDSVKAIIPTGNRISETIALH